MVIHLGVPPIAIIMLIIRSYFDLIFVHHGISLTLALCNPFDDQHHHDHDQLDLRGLKWQQEEEGPGVS